MPSISYKIEIPNTWNKDTYQIFINSLLTLGDQKYLDFNKKITPTTYEMIGIRVPILRRIAKEIKKTNIIDFLENTQANYFEEILIEGFVIGYITDYDIFFKYFEKFLFHVDNWAVCDLCVSSFKIIKMNKETFISVIDDLVKSDKTYYIRVGIVSLLEHYLDDKEYLNYFFCTMDSIDSDDYYVDMAIAWFISYLFIYYRDDTISYLKKNHLNKFTQNKAISKIRDSFRVSKSDKELVLEYRK